MYKYTCMHVHSFTQFPLCALPKRHPHRPLVNQGASGGGLRRSRALHAAPQEWQAGRAVTADRTWPALSSRKWLGAFLEMEVVPNAADTFWVMVVGCRVFWALNQESGILPSETSQKVGHRLREPLFFLFAVGCGRLRV